MGLETKEPQGELSIEGLPQVLHELEVAPLAGRPPRGIEPPHVILPHFGTDPVSSASSDTRTPKLAGADGSLRFNGPELDLAAVEELRVNGPTLLRDSRGEIF